MSDSNIALIRLLLHKISTLEHKIILLEQIIGDRGCGEEIILNEIKLETESEMDRWDSEGN